MPSKAADPKNPVHKGRNKPDHPRRAESLLLQQQVLHLRLHASTFQSIAEAMGKPLSTVKDAYRRALEDIREEVAQNTTQLRAQECARLDMYLSKLAPMVDKGDIAAIWRAMKISERRARLLGLDAQPEPYGYNPNPGSGVPAQIAVVFVQANNNLLQPPIDVTPPPHANGHGAPAVEFVRAKDDTKA